MSINRFKWVCRLSVFVGVTVILLFFVNSLCSPYSNASWEWGEVSTNHKTKTANRKCPESPSPWTKIDKTQPGVHAKDSACADSSNPYEDTSGWKTFQAALKQYSEFHKLQLNMLKNTSHPESKTVRTLTWACRQDECSGLGDQFYRIHFFLLMAMMSDRVFTIYWDEGLQRTTKYLLPNQIDWSFFKENLGMCEDSHHCSEQKFFGKTHIFWHSWDARDLSKFSQVLFSSESHITVSGLLRLDTMLATDYTYFQPETLLSQGFDRMGVTDILSLDRNTKVLFKYAGDSVWSYLSQMLGIDSVVQIPSQDRGEVEITGPWFYLSQSMMDYLFVFPKDLIDMVDKMQAFLGVEGRRYLAVHLRTGFFGTKIQENLRTRWFHKNVKMFYDEKSWTSIMDHSIKLSKSTIGPNSPIYLSTDSPFAKEWVLRKYSHHNIKSTNLTVVHSAHHSSSCSKEYYDANVSFWIDLLLLGRAHMVVHGYSSFAMTAGFLCPIPLSHHSWTITSNELQCLASYILTNVTCI